MADLHDLVAAYAVDAVDGAERATFEAHLESCEQCRAELATLAPAALALAEEAAARPPEGMRAAVLDAVARTPQEGSEEVPAPAAPARRRWLAPRWVTSLATAVVVVVVLAVSGVIGGGVSLEDVRAAADSTEVTLSGDIGSASFVYSDDLDTGFFQATNLPNVASDETFQLWLINDEGPVSAGTFTPTRSGGVNVRVSGDIAPGVTLGLTIEPAGGSPAPTGEVLLAEVLG